MERILLVEDEPSLQLALGDTIEEEGFAVDVLGTVRDALEAMVRQLPDLVISDLRLPDGDGMDVLRQARRIDSELPVIILTAYGTIDGAVEAIREGAVDYLTKPFEEKHLTSVIRRNLELRRLRRRVEELEGMPSRPIGDAPVFCKAVELATTAARSDVTILILGETGTGKEVVARLVHDCSPRRNRPFIAVNCAALPEALLEAELFGHERGAFTGALRQRRGRFEEADGGTLFLDEVAEMSPGVQAKLLRVIEEQHFERLGSNTSIAVDVRILAATRRDLETEVQTGRFRDDLYYRLKVVPVLIPPLRERPGDVVLLAHHFARRFAAELHREFEFAPEALDCLAHHHFPGNVRELQHLVHRLAVTCPKPVITAADLPDEYGRLCHPRLDLPIGRFEGSLPEMMAQFEHTVLDAMLTRFDGHRGRIASALGISRKNLWEKLRDHGLGG